MKYIVFRTAGEITRLHPVIFPNALAHADVVVALTNGASPELKGAVADSAGEFTPVSGSCHGKSFTLGNLPSKPERDTRLIMMNDYGVDLAMVDAE